MGKRKRSHGRAAHARRNSPKTAPPGNAKKAKTAQSSSSFWRFTWVIAGALGLLLIAIWYATSSHGVSLDLLPNPDLRAMERQVAKKIRFLRAEVEKDPSSSNAWGTFAMNLDVHELKSESVVCYKQAAALAPTEFKWPYYCAIALSETGSSDALQWFERSLALDPNYAPLLNLYGQALLNQRRIGESSQAFRQAIAADSKLPYAYHGLAQIALTKGDVQASRRHLLKALEISPDYGEARGLLAVVYRRLGQIEKANRELRYVQQLPEFSAMPDPIHANLAAEGVSSWWYKRRGQAYLAKGLYESAVKEFRMRLLLKADAQSHNNLGLALQKLGNHDEALEQLQAAIALDADYVEALNNLAAALYERGQVQAALDYLHKALKLNPAFPDANLNLATFHLRAGKTAAAINVFRQGLAQSPGHVKLAARLAWVLATTKRANLRDGGEAVRLATAICNMTNYRAPENLDVLAAAHAEQGDFEKALQIGQQAQQLVKSPRSHLAQQIESHLKLYRENKPVRE